MPYTVWEMSLSNEHYVNNGSTVNVCSLDLSKAFEHMNHYALFIKLMDRKLPNELLSLLEQSFSISVICVRWGACYSHFFSLLAVWDKERSCHLFSSLFIDSLIDKVRSTGVGCYLSYRCVSIFVCWRYIVNCAVRFCPADTVACLWGRTETVGHAIKYTKVRVYTFWSTLQSSM